MRNYVIIGILMRTPEILTRTIDFARNHRRGLVRYVAIPLGVIELSAAGLLVVQHGDQLRVDANTLMSGGDNGGLATPELSKSPGLTNTPTVIYTPRSVTPTFSPTIPRDWVTVTPSPTEKSTPDTRATTKPNSLATALAPVREELENIRELKEFFREGNDILNEPFKKTAPPSQLAPSPFVVKPEVVKPEVVKPEVIIIQPQPPAPDSTDAGIKAAMAIETITQGRLNEIASATARAPSPTPYFTPGPVRLEFQTPVDVRIKEEGGLPWWGTVLITLGAVGLTALFARRRIVNYIHTHFPPPPAAPPGP